MARPRSPDQSESFHTMQTNAEKSNAPLSANSSPLLPAARAYIAREWNPVPVKAFRKAPTGGEGWQRQRITNENVDTHFRNRDGNIGVQLGAASGGLTDVDLDCPEAIEAAHRLLPRTNAMFGRASARYAHRLYGSDLYERQQKAVINFDDPIREKDKRLLEVRIGSGDKGAQTVFPPSTHESGEAINWEEGCDGEPAKVDGAELLKRAGWAAAAALLARYYPHESGASANAGIASLLAQSGMTKNITKLFAQALISPSSKDKLASLLSAIEVAVAAKDRGEAPRGDIADSYDTKVADAVHAWLGVKRSETSRATTDAPSKAKSSRAKADMLRESTPLPIRDGGGPPIPSGEKIFH